MADNTDCNFIVIGHEEEFFQPDNLYAIGHKSDCKSIEISENYARGDVCFYSATGYAWQLANNARILEASAELWMIISASGNSGDVVTVSRLCDAKIGGWNYGSNRGSPMWLDSTDGKMTPTLPTAPAYVRLCGWLDTSGQVVRFNPAGRCIQGV